jgi:hypothetical protein
MQAWNDIPENNGTYELYRLRKNAFGLSFRGVRRLTDRNDSLEGFFRSLCRNRG